MSEVEPFIVRGHHAKNLWSILYRGKTVDGVIDDLSGEAGKANDDRTDYFIDIYGTTPETTQQFNTGYREYLQTFLELQDDTPVRFVEKQRDGICKACVIGAHCMRPNEYEAGDRWAIDAIRSVGKDLGLNELVDNGYSQSDTVSLEIPAWAAKQIIGNYDFFPSAFIPPIWPAEKQMRARALMARLYPRPSIESGS